MSEGQNRLCFVPVEAGLLGQLGELDKVLFHQCVPVGTCGDFDSRRRWPRGGRLDDFGHLDIHEYVILIQVRADIFVFVLRAGDLGQVMIVDIAADHLRPDFVEHAQAFFHGVFTLPLCQALRFVPVMDIHQLCPETRAFHSRTGNQGSMTVSKQGFGGQQGLGGFQIGIERVMVPIQRQGDNAADLPRDDCRLCLKPLDECLAVLLCLASILNE